MDIVKNKLEHLADTQPIVEKYTDKVPGYSKYNPYPFITQSNFNQLLYDTKVFRDLENIKNINDGSLRLKKSQEFIKLFLSPETGYNSALIYHGVGVGKTCATISNTEPNKNNYKRIYVLSPSLEDNWRDELFNKDKELNKKPNTNVQCTCSIYSKLVTHLMPNEVEIRPNIHTKQLKQLIKENKVSYARE